MAVGALALLASARAFAQPTLLADDFETGGVCGGWSLVVGATQANCAGAGWHAHEWPLIVSWAPCTTVRVYGLVAGDRLLLTTCSPTEASATGDPVIQTVVDSAGNNYPVANDDCDLASNVPQLLSWNCLNQAGFLRMSCSPPDGAGFEVLGTWIDITVCGHNSSAGQSPLYIWANGTSTPNPG